MPESLNVMTQTKEAQRAARLRDNKRRHRQRQKEYTAGLETKLRQLQNESVRATQEVQMSARKVVEDNARLKALLRHVGVEDHVIETWTPFDKEKLCGRSTTSVNKALTKSTDKDELPATAFSSRMTPPQNLDEHDATSLAQSEPMNFCQKACASKTLEFTPEIKFDVSSRLPPCKVLTRLAENPNADITQSVETDEPRDEKDDDGVECSKAHSMLMQFATTEEKLDTISLALERGCVGKKSGGCKVRNEAIWKAMDDVT